MVAGFPTIKSTGKIHPQTPVTIDIAEEDEIYAIGEAQAIATFSYGTSEIKIAHIKRKQTMI